VAFGHTLVRRSLDLSTVTTLATATIDITQLFIVGDLLYYNSRTAFAEPIYNTISRTTLQPGPQTGGSGRVYPRLAVAPSSRRVFIPNGEKLALDTEGRFAALERPLHTHAFPGGSKVFISPDEQ